MRGATPNPELELAEAFVEQTDRHLFLTGKAGTGKTTFLRQIRNKSPKRSAATATRSCPHSLGFDSRSAIHDSTSRVIVQLRIMQPRTITRRSKPIPGWEDVRRGRQLTFSNSK